MTQYNFNKNFKNFRDEISLTKEDRQNLTDARKTIRGTIRQVFNEMPTKYFTDNIQTVLAEFSKNTNDKIKPKFMTQGSYAYNTINQPAKPLIQQMDLDDGVYLPLSYVEDKANGNFNQAAGIVRNVIYNCVSDLCYEENWGVKKHSKCLRIIINDTSHIDLPIYSIPDNQTITNSAEFAQMSNFERFYHMTKLKTYYLPPMMAGWSQTQEI